MTPPLATLAPLPVTAAADSRALFAEVRALIAAEPLRFRIDWHYSRWRRAEGCDDQPPPACGTVACFAGWLVLLRRPGARGEGDLYQLVVPVLHEVSGGDPELERVMGEELFYNLQPFEKVAYGTAAYRDLALALLDGFLARHGERLAAIPLGPPPGVSA